MIGARGKITVFFKSGTIRVYDSHIGQVVPGWLSITDDSGAQNIFPSDMIGRVDFVPAEQRSKGD